MTDDKQLQLPGRYGCMFRATPARLYGQFSSFSCAYLFYDFVLVAGLDECIDVHTNSILAKSIMRNAFNLSKKFGIAIDPEDTLSEDDRRPTVKSAKAMFAEDTAAAAYLAEFLRLDEAARVAVKREDGFVEKLRADQGVGSDDVLRIPDEFDELSSELVKARNKSIIVMQDFLYKNTLKEKGYDIDDGTLASGLWSDSNNDLLRSTVRDGRIPLVPTDENLPVIRAGEEFRTFALMLKSVPIPTDMSPNEFIEFRNSKTVRKSVGRFRQLAGELVQGQAPTRYVVDELMSRYEDYKIEVRRAGVKTVLGNVKFLVSTLAGSAEDVVKLRLENLSRRPFEVVEYFVDRKYKDVASTESPFYFLVQKDREMP
jgi:hypothetical protein